jgi:D-xylonolactonase
MEPRLIADYACHCGEGPIWHPDEKCIYWTDIPNGLLFRYDPASERHVQCYQGEPVGGLTIQEDGALLLFLNRGRIAIWRDGEMTTIVDEIPDEVETRFNDVIADPAGRVFCGAMPTKDRPGRLYRLDTDGSLRIVLEGVSCSNGLGFTLDRRQMYFTDSEKREIYLFDYDEASGEISNRRLFAKAEDGGGLPDGMTVDAEGNVWSARWDGSCAVRYAPDGTELSRVHLPAPKVSSITFGGENYEDAYLTTAGGDQRDKDGEYAGALFRIGLGVRGLPEFRSRIKS